MRDFLQWRRRDAVMLAEANVPPEENLSYFGEQGDRLQMMLNFPVNQRLWYALATADLEPLKWAIDETRKVPQHAQFVQFLRSHDECDLGRLTQQRDPNSLLNWTERRIRARTELPEIGWGECTVLETDVPSVLALRYVWRIRRSPFSKTIAATERKAD